MSPDPSENVPSTVPPVESISQAKSGPHWLALLIGVIVGGLLVGGGVLAYMYSRPDTTQLVSAPSPTPTTTTISPTPTNPNQVNTSNWKVYTNTENGYTIKYPGDQFARKLCPDEELLLQVKTQGVVDDTKVAETCARDGIFALEVVTSEDDYAGLSGEFYNITSQKINVDNRQADKIVMQLKAGVDCLCPEWFTRVIIRSDGKSIIIHYSVKEKAELLDEILTTFKLL